MSAENPHTGTAVLIIFVAKPYLLQVKRPKKLICHKSGQTVYVFYLHSYKKGIIKFPSMLTWKFTKVLFTILIRSRKVINLSKRNKLEALNLDNHWTWAYTESSSYPSVSETIFTTYFGFSFRQLKHEKCIMWICLGFLFYVYFS